MACKVAATRLCHGRGRSARRRDGRDPVRSRRACRDRGGAMSVRIVGVRELTLPVGISGANAAIRYDAMTVSLIAVATDVVRAGRRVVGVGLDSHGRYGHGKLLLERFVPRVLAADPKTLLDPGGATLDPAAVWRAAMADEKAGGHGERAGALGLLDMAIWDIVAQLERKPLWRVLAERHGDPAADGRTWVYAPGGHYRDGDDLAQLEAELP